MFIVAGQKLALCNGAKAGTWIAARAVPASTAAAEGRTGHPGLAPYCRNCRGLSLLPFTAVGCHTHAPSHPHVQAPLYPNPAQARRTTMTVAGASAREIADYLEHERVSMTQDVYMSRGVTGDAAMAALERPSPPESCG